MKPQEISAIVEPLLSAAKINLYKKHHSDKWLEAYMTELFLAKEFLIYLHFLEIFLRNKIAIELSADFGNWLCDQPSILNFVERDKIEKITIALKRSGKKTSLDNIISNLNFGFWTNLFHRSYNCSIWQQNKMMERVFPFLKSHQRNIKKIRQDLEAIRKFRNRIFHFENLKSWDFEEMEILIDKFIFGISGLEVREILGG
jgi:hypothetical protein